MIPLDSLGRELLGKGFETTGKCRFIASFILDFRTQIFNINTGVDSAYFSSVETWVKNLEYGPDEGGNGFSIENGMGMT